LDSFPLAFPAMTPFFWSFVAFLRRYIGPSQPPDSTVELTQALLVTRDVPGSPFRNFDNDFGPSPLGPDWRLPRGLFISQNLL